MAILGKSSVETYAKTIEFDKIIMHNYIFVF